MTGDTDNAVAEIERLVRGGQMPAAEQVCREVVARWPQEHRAWSWLAMLHVLQGRGAEAEAAIRRAIGLFSGDARYWNSLCLALRLQARPAEAEAAVRQALTLADTAEYWAGLGDCLLEQRQFSGAAQAY